MQRNTSNILHTYILQVFIHLPDFSKTYVIYIHLYIIIQLFGKIPYITYPSPCFGILRFFYESSSRWLQNRWKDGEVVLSEVETIGFLMVKWYGSNPSSWGFKGGWLVDWLLGWMISWLVGWLLGWFFFSNRIHEIERKGETYWNTNAPEVTRLTPQRGGWRFGVKIYSVFKWKKRRCFRKLGDKRGTLYILSRVLKVHLWYFMIFMIALKHFHVHAVKLLQEYNTLPVVVGRLVDVKSKYRD